MRSVGRRQSGPVIQAQARAAARRRGLAVVDAAVTATKGAKARQALRVLAIQCARDIGPAGFTEGEHIRVADEITVDLLLTPLNPRPQDIQNRRVLRRALEELQRR